MTDTMALLQRRIPDDNSLRAFLAALVQAARDGRLEEVEHVQSRE